MDAQKTPTPQAKPARNGWQRAWDFTKEIWNDHDFWIRAFAVKGGASAIVIAGVVGITYVLALPVLLAAAGVAICVGLIGFGLGGIFLGATRGWDKLKLAYSKTFSTRPPKEKTGEVKSSLQRMGESPRIRKLLEKPFMQKLSNSHAGKIARKLAQKQEEVILTGLAGGGSIAAIVGATVLATNLLVFSIIVVPFAAMAVLAGIASGIYGIKLTVPRLYHSLRGGKKKTTEASPPPAPQPEAEPQTATAALTTDFAKAGEKAEKKPDPDPPAPPTTAPAKPAVP